MTGPNTGGKGHCGAPMQLRGRRGCDILDSVFVIFQKIVGKPFPTLVAESPDIVVNGSLSTRCRAADRNSATVLRWCERRPRVCDAGLILSGAVNTRGGQAHMSWTDERVETLRKLWLGGHSASQVAAELGGVTRNAVIGKVHRLGLSGRGQPTSSIKRARRPSQSTHRRQQPHARTIGNTALKLDYDIAAHADLRPLNDIVVPIAKRLSIEMLTERTCKWPIGDPTQDDFHFCGHDSLESAPYCEYHASVAYQTPEPRKRQRRAAFG